MADRAVEQSAAYLALSVAGRRVCAVLLRQAARGAVAISLGRFMELTGLCRSSVRVGVKQVELLGFATVGIGHRSVGVFAAR